MHGGVSFVNTDVISSSDFNIVAIAPLYILVGIK